jgi:hypothetical protein
MVAPGGGVMSPATSPVSLLRGHDLAGRDAVKQNVTQECGATFLQSLRIPTHVSESDDYRKLLTRCTLLRQQSVPILTPAGQSPGPQAEAGPGPPGRWQNSGRCQDRAGLRLTCGITRSSGGANPLD